MPSSRRERELARQRHLRRQQQLAAQRARTRRRNGIIAGSVVGALVLGGAVFGLIQLLGGEDDATLAATPPKPSPTASAAADCAYTKDGESAEGKEVTPPSAAGLERRKDYGATLTTNRGTVKFTMQSSKAPCTVNSFRTLAAQDFFDDTPCHRLTTSGIFVLQCGDPTGTGSGGPGYSFPDENLAGATYEAGTVAMANSGPNTNGSQFFLVYKDSQLPPNYTPFGTITAGMDVLRKVADRGSDPEGDGKPKLAVTIEDFTIRPT